jgi:hypothetical protein
MFMSTVDLLMAAQELTNPATVVAVAAVVADQTAALVIVSPVEM